MTCLSWALAYEREGLSVVPARLVGKRPLVAWKPWQQQRPDPEQLRIWWRRWPRANVAVITGRISNLVVVDIDPRAGGWKTLAALEAANQELDRSAVVQTPSGGLHYWFRHPGGRFTNSNKAIQERYGGGVDVRGDGGLVLAPPSVRADGEYRWRGGSPASIPQMPGWLVEVCRPTITRRIRQPIKAADPAGVLVVSRLAALEREVKTAEKGNRNNMLYWAGQRLREMVDAGQVSADWAKTLEHAAVEAGLTEKAARSTIASALGVGVGDLP